MKDKKIRNNILSITLLIISTTILSYIYYVYTILGEVNFYELLFYFTNDTGGTPNIIFLDAIRRCIIPFILIFIIILIPTINFKLKGKNYNITGKHKILYSIIIFTISFLLLLKNVHFDKFIINTTKKTDIYEKSYKDTNKVNVTFNEKRNLILIYLESVETSLVSKENGGAFNESRIPELEKIALENINFSNTNKLGGGYNLNLTSWTMASAIASSSGSPVLSSLKNIKYKNKKPMPNVKTLGDILKENGYNLELIQGTDSSFGGTKKYFQTHGNYKIFDYKTAIKEKYINEDYFKWWGYEDKKLFEYSKSEITNLSKKDIPFAVTIFTMDTHFEDGYLDKSCKTPFKDKMSNVYACSSTIINDFINWIKEQDFYKNTTIVLIGDHLTMQGSYYKNYKDYTRTIYNAFINTKQSSDYTKNREFSSLDMYPTILASLGALIEGNKLGFGVNLFSGEPTMIEQLGKEKFNNELLKKSDYYLNNILTYNKYDK